MPQKWWRPKSNGSHCPKRPEKVMQCCWVLRIVKQLNTCQNWAFSIWFKFHFTIFHMFSVSFIWQIKLYKFDVYSMKKITLFIRVTVCGICRHICGGQRTMFRNHFSPSMWVLVTEVRLPVLVASALIYWAINPAQDTYFFPKHIHILGYSQIPVWFKQSDEVVYFKNDFKSFQNVTLATYNSS